MNETDILPAPEITSLTTVEASKWEREKQAFRRLLPDLLKTHCGQYVAIHGEQVVGSGTDQRQLARESYQKHGYVPIYVGLVTDAPPTPVRVPTPWTGNRRLTRESGWSVKPAGLQQPLSLHEFQTDAVDSDRRSRREPTSEETTIADDARKVAAERENQAEGG